jgi:hypothetical protein
MKKVEKTKAGLTGLTPTALVEKGRNHIERCTRNTNVTLPADFLENLGMACDDLEAANIQVRENGGRKDLLIRDARALTVKSMIRTLASYVDAQCEGDGVKINSTGFELHRSPQPVGVLDAPTNVRAERGNQRGDVVLRWNAKRGRTQYVVQMNSGDPKVEENWKWLASTTKIMHTISGLETDKQYYFRLRAHSAAGKGKMSDVAMSKAA